MITMLILTIPVINIIMYLVWGFGSSGNTSRKTFCQATMLWMLILVGGMLIFGSIGSLSQEFLPVK